MYSCYATAVFKKQGLKTLQNAQQSWHLTSEVKFLYQRDSLALGVCMAQLYDGIVNADPKVDCVQVHLRTGVAFHSFDKLENQSGEKVSARP